MMVWVNRTVIPGLTFLVRQCNQDSDYKKLKALTDISGCITETIPLLVMVQEKLHHSILEFTCTHALLKPSTACDMH